MKHRLLFLLSVSFSRFTVTFITLQYPHFTPAVQFFISILHFIFALLIARSLFLKSCFTKLFWCFHRTEKPVLSCVTTTGGTRRVWISRRQNTTQPTTLSNSKGLLSTYNRKRTSISLELMSVRTTARLAPSGFFSTFKIVPVSPVNLCTGEIKTK